MKPLYFVAVLLPPELADQVTALKKEAGQLFDAWHALNAPPHITLVPPFRAELGGLSGMSGLISAGEPFEIELEGIGAFPKRTLFAKVKSNDNLTYWRNTLQQWFYDQGFIKRVENRPFRPHVTFASRDLDESKFETARAHFFEKEINGKFRCNGFSLMRHEGGRWGETNKWGFGL